MKDSKVGVRLAFRGTMPPRRKPSMLRRTLFASAAAFAGPAIVGRAALGQKPRTVRMGTAQTTTTSAAFLMPDLLKPDGIELDLVMLPAPVARMQAVASGEVDLCNGGLAAALQV